MITDKEIMKNEPEEVDGTNEYNLGRLAGYHLGAWWMRDQLRTKMEKEIEKIKKKQSKYSKPEMYGIISRDIDIYKEAVTLRAQKQMLQKLLK